MDKLYIDFIDKKNDENYEERYTNNEGWYKASSAGFCSRKQYYESVLKLVPTLKPKPDGLMKMRLGTIFHNELQGALKETEDLSIYYRSIYNIEDTLIDIANYAVMAIIVQRKQWGK